MKLYLSSFRIPDIEPILELAGKPASEIKVAVIPNAKDYYAKRARDFKIRQTKEYLEGHDLNVEIVDLKEYSDEDALSKKLGKFDMIWVSGGNTFCLRYEMKRSGFENIVAPLLEKGLLYCGESAGSCVAGNSLKGIEDEDEPEFAERVYWDGLELVNHYILPHADNPGFNEIVLKTREVHAGDPTYIELSDNQALVVDGISERIVTGLTQ